MKRFHTPRCLLMMGMLIASTPALPATSQVLAQDDSVSHSIEQDYQLTIRPFLKRYCYDCHGPDKAEAEIDLAVFETTDQARSQTKAWLKVRQMLDSEQMPPKEADQPTDDERAQAQQWVHRMLTEEAQARAGDPGPVVLRRLNNAEYNYSVRDLTGIESLDPTREFPVDGAAGEGFTNVGSGQAMSPALVQKYLDAAKEVASHVVLLPEGIRFSAASTRRDQTNELLAEIQAFYRQFTADGGGAAVDLQGIKFNTNQGGLLPLEQYLAATLVERDALIRGQKRIEEVARERSLNARYLAKLWNTLNRRDRASFLIERVRERWASASANDAAALADEIARLQKALWKFNPVGHIGRENGPQSWMEAVSPVRDRYELRFALPTEPTGSDIVVYLASHDLGDGNEQDYVVWQRPHLEFVANRSGSAKPPILIRDLRATAERVRQTIAAESVRTGKYLSAVSKLHSSTSPISVIAKSDGLDPRLLENWSELLGFGQPGNLEITGLFSEKLTRVSGYEAINGWGSPQTPSLLTNRSDHPIKFLTLTIPARGVTVHPSPTQESAIRWRSPLNTRLSIEGFVADADHQCGNGAGWRLERQTQSGVSVLAEGLIDNGGKQKFKTDNVLEVNAGDVVSLVLNARDNDHSCDTTEVELRLSEVDGDQRHWDLTSDIVDNVLDGNPLRDTYGNERIWHFCANEVQSQSAPTVTPGSSLDRWRTAIAASVPEEETRRLESVVERTLTSNNPEGLDEPDRILRKQLLDWLGPLDWIAVAGEGTTNFPADSNSQYGLDPALFGIAADGLPVDAADLCVQAPHLLQLRIPAEFVAGAELVTTVLLHEPSGREGSVQPVVSITRPDDSSVSAEFPFLVGADIQSRRRVEMAIDQFRELFPPALCYAQLVPLDEVVTLTLFYREDDYLRRLMLDDRQLAELDRLWDELRFVSQEPLQMVVAFEQISEFATQDRPDLVQEFAPMGEGIRARATTYEHQLLETEPTHIDAVVEFADRAWRRRSAETERQELRDLYARLRADEISHEQAIQLVISRVLTSPAFLFKLEQPAPGEHAEPVTDSELATRLSYFLWSSIPDDELSEAAIAGKLTSDQELIAQTRRMLDDPRTRRLAIQFGTQWLHLRDFDENNDKNENLFPDFPQRRVEMYEETVQFFEDMFRNDRSVMGILDANYTFLNESLARHYGIEGVEGNQWRRFDGVREFGRGGVLGMASFLASQSGASRTSPILRGNWIYETLLGERLPRPPAGVPQIPDELPNGLTARQAIEQHSSVMACARCHAKIDPFGFALEQYDAIGRIRPAPVNTSTKLTDGKEIQGIEGLRDYLVTDRREDVLRQFCRKLLGFSLGRELQLSDDPLVDRIVTELANHEYRFSVAVELIVTSRQFREIRGRQPLGD